MSAEEACVINVQSGQDVGIPPHHINIQNVRKQGIIEKLKLLLGAVLGTEEADDEQALYRDSKTLLIISGVIMSANYSAITSLPSNLENRDEGVRQGVLIPATLSLMTTLFVMAAQVAMPTFNFRKVKMLVALSIIFTAYSYINFVAMKLGHLSQEKAYFGEKEWHLFTPRDRKYPNGSRPNKAAGTRYWKATGADKLITNKRRKQESGHHEDTCFLCWEGSQGSQDQLGSA